MEASTRLPIRVKRYSFGAHGEPLNVRFASKATELLRRRVMSRMGTIAAMALFRAGASQCNLIEVCWWDNAEIASFRVRDGRACGRAYHRPVAFYGGNAMKRPRRQFLLLAASAAALTAIAALSDHGAWSQTRTIKIVVPFAPGGPVDIVARVLAEQVGRAQGPTIVIENRPGAGTIIGTEAASRAAPDGNTLLISTNTFVIAPQLRKATYDVLTGFEPICHVASTAAVIAVNTASPYRTLADLFHAARAKPGDLTLASFGPAGAYHIAVEMLKRAADVNMTYVPYSGDIPAVNALLGGHVTSVLASYISVIEQVKAGKLRALAITSRTRIDTLPDVPTVAESGYKDYEVDIWYGIFAPAKTPNEAVSQLSSWFTSAIQVPEVSAKLGVQGLNPVGTCGADFGAYIRKQYDDYGRVIREANIKVE